jgi:hypothetical protein
VLPGKCGTAIRYIDRSITDADWTKFTLEIFQTPSRNEFEHWPAVLFSSQK